MVLVSKKTLFFLISPSVILLLFFGVFLLSLSFFYSLHWYNPIITGSKLNYVGLNNYISLLSSSEFWNAMKVTSIFAILSVSIGFLIGMGLALLLFSVGEFRGVSFIRTLLTSPLLMPPLIVGLMFRYMFQYDYGLFNQILVALGLHQVDWLGFGINAFISWLITDIWQWFPYMFLVLLAGLYSIPTEQIEAANVEGASGWQLFRYIIIPWLKPTILVVLSIRIIDALKEVDKVYILTFGGPGSATTSLVFGAFLTSFQFWHIGLGAAYSYLILIIINFFIYFILKYIKR
jgi:multiple sugar transport system permease protein